MSRSSAIRSWTLLYGLLLGMALFAPLSCGKEPPPERIDLPPTPVLTLRSNWAVVRSPFLRLRVEPRRNASILAHLRQGSVLEIISRTENKETVDKATAYWYQVNYGGLRGWVFGAFLAIADSRSKAESLAAQLE